MGKTNRERAWEIQNDWECGGNLNDMITAALDQAHAVECGQSCCCGDGHVIGIDTEHTEDYGTEAVFENGIGVVSGFFKVPASAINDGQAARSGIDQLKEALDAERKKSYELYVKLQLLEDIRRHDMQSLGKAYDEIEQLHELCDSIQKMYAESQVKYTVYQAEAFADDLASAAYGVANHNSAENNEDLEEMHKAVVNAITGSAKPQFDAEEARGLIDALRDFAIDVGKGKHAQWYMEEAQRRLLVALGLEENDGKE